MPSLSPLLVHCHHLCSSLMWDMALLQIHSKRPHHTINLNELRLSLSLESCRRLLHLSHKIKTVFLFHYFYRQSWGNTFRKQQRTSLWGKKVLTFFLHFGLQHVFGFKEQIWLLVKCSFAFNLPDLQSWRAVSNTNRSVIYFYFLLPSGIGGTHNRKMELMRWFVVEKQDGTWTRDMQVLMRSQNISFQKIRTDVHVLASETHIAHQKIMSCFWR